MSIGVDGGAVFDNGEMSYSDPGRLLDQAVNIFNNVVEMCFFARYVCCVCSAASPD